MNPNEAYKPGDESILVCVFFPPDAERLIRRGWTIAKSFDAPLHVITVENSREDEDYLENQQNHEEWKRLSDEYNADFIIEPANGRKVAEVIVDVAKEREITQIVIGKSARSKWQELTKGAIATEILKRIDFVDVHIVSVQRELPPSFGDYQKGVRAFLTKENETYTLHLGNCPEGCIEGIFFKDMHTDFESGLFKTFHGKEIVIGRVINGTVREKIFPKE
ncbi:universal stress protein family protein [Sinobaca qinghaiensis]|uniref:Universal stress protein family protein n=1 Tax=Sinobaca qinghaiensis TaxID=342944 RepID=A0A419V4D9_9BACL|nr:universal stress protein [Sinobaca qinghaiensis]RKD73388.1 universal stress protein family protein [Sinobaca qinghaiensis]